MLKFTETIRKKIHAFNQYCLKLPDAQIDKASKKQKLKLVKDNWMLASGDGLSSSAMKYSVLDTIKADVGSSGFLAPRQIMQKLQAIDENDIVEYSGNRVPDTLTKLLQTYCEEERIIKKDITLSSDVLIDTDTGEKTKYAVVGNGTHSLITVLFSTLIKTPGDVIVITDPTYGLLLNGITNAGGNYKAFPLEKEDGFKPSPQKLKSFINTINGKLITKFTNDLETSEQLLKVFISNSTKQIELNLLFNTLRATLKSKNTQEIDALIEQINNFVTENVNHKRHSKLSIQQHLLKNCPRVRGFLSINPQTPAGSVLQQKEVNNIADALQDIDDLIIIDDLTHKDIMLSDKKAGSFSASSASNKTVSLFSFSKSFGLAGVRAGIGIGPQSLIKPMTESIFDQQSMISTYAITAIEATLKMKKSERDKYIKENNEVYTFRKNLIDAVVHGIHTISDKTLRNDIKNTIRQLPNFRKDFKDSLLKGITGLDFVNDPEGGFFVQLDFSAFKGKYLGQTQLNHSLHFHQAFDYLADLHTVPNELNFHFDTTSLRFAVTMTDAEICEALLRIKGILSLLTDEPKEMLKKTIQQKEETSLATKPSGIKTLKASQIRAKQQETKTRKTTPSSTTKHTYAEVPTVSITNKDAEVPTVAETFESKALLTQFKQKKKANVQTRSVADGEVPTVAATSKSKALLTQFKQKKKANVQTRSVAKAEALKKKDLPIASRKKERTRKVPNRYR